jgi:hypothetical protein
MPSVTPISACVSSSMNRNAMMRRSRSDSASSIGRSDSRRSTASNSGSGPPTRSKAEIISPSADTRGCDNGRYALPTPPGSVNVGGAEAERGAEIRRPRHTLELPCQVLGGDRQGDAGFLEPARHPDCPGGIAEVSLDFAEDGRGGVARERYVPAGVVPVDRLDQPDRGDLTEVAQRFVAAGVSAGSPRESSRRTVPADPGTGSAVFVRPCPVRAGIIAALFWDSSSVAGVVAWVRHTATGDERGIGIDLVMLALQMVGSPETRASSAMRMDRDVISSLDVTRVARRKAPQPVWQARVARPMVSRCRIAWA